MGGKIYLIQAGITGRAHAVKTRLHELLHFGVRRYARMVTGAGRLITQLIEE